MTMYKILSRASRRSVFRRSLTLLISSKKLLQHQFDAGYVPVFNSSAIYVVPNQRFWFASSVAPEASDKEQGGTAESSDASTVAEQGKKDEGAKLSEQGEDSVSEESKKSDSEADDELTMDDLVKLVAEKDEQVKLKNQEIEQIQDKVLRCYAEMENVMQRTKCEGENSKKFAIQNFAKSLLDVGDNLGRASSVVKDSFSKVDTSNDTAGVFPLLKTLLEGAQMTEKQLLEVFKKFGIEKFDPTNEPFDPHRHNAVFQIPDATKPPGTVAAVLKAGYVLYDRVIRPAEVGVVQAVDEDEQANNDSSKGSDA